MKLSKTIAARTKTTGTPVIKTILVIALAMVVAACGTKPPMPKKPNESKRIPVNKTIPTELEKSY